MEPDISSTCSIVGSISSWTFSWLFHGGSVVSVFAVSERRPIPIVCIHCWISVFIGFTDNLLEFLPATPHFAPLILWGRSVDLWNTMKFNWRPVVYWRRLMYFNFFMLGLNLGSYQADAKRGRTH